MPKNNVGEWSSVTIHSIDIGAWPWAVEAFKRRLAEFVSTGE
jgi:hypothetical protein